MLMDLYRAMNKEFHPTATDIASFARIFDRDNKGKITFEDMEKFIVKYYCNEEWSQSMAIILYIVHDSNEDSHQKSISCTSIGFP